MRISSVTIIAALTASAIPALGAHVLHERRDILHPAWTKRSSPSGDVMVPVSIGMSQRNLELGHDLLMEVSEHDSPKYGKHYTEEEIHELFAPSSETVEAILGWLESSGVARHRVSRSLNMQWVQFDSPIGELEKLLKTKYYVYEHESGHDHVACDEYYVPSDIQHHVDYITPGIQLRTTGFGKTRRKRDVEKREQRTRSTRPGSKDLPVSIAKVEANSDKGRLGLCDAVVSPNCIRAMYKIPKANVSGGNILGIYESYGDHYAQGDLNLFFSRVAPEIPPGTHPVLNGIDGATGPTDLDHSGIESAIDFQISYPIIYPSNSVLYQTDDDYISSHYRRYAGLFNNFFDAIDGSYCRFNPFNQTLPPKQDPHYPDPHKGGYKGKLQCGKYKATKVISISYGTSEHGISNKYDRRQCMEIMKLGMQGISVVVSTGDDGVAHFEGYPSPNGCLPYGNKNGSIFTPDFPATCPYAITVGSTYLPAGADATKDEEVATTYFASGGGFSNLFARPAYQKAAVNGYLTNYPPPYPSYKSLSNHGFGKGKGGLFNSIGRAYPDFAALGDNMLFYIRGRGALAYGTSISAPIFASILARINQERLALGKSTVGFVNPTLYAHPEVFHDITVGHNPGCGTKGFAAKPGWDPVTGLGTPNYAKMLKLYKSLP